MDIAASFSTSQLVAFLVEVVGNIRRYGHRGFADVFALAGQNQQSSDLNGHALGGLNHAGADATGALLVRGSA